MNSFLFGNHERQPSATSCSTSPCFVLAFSACLLSQPKTRLLHGCLPSKNTFPSHPLQHDHPSNKHVSHGNYIYTQKDLLGNHIDWLSRDVFHSDKSTPFCHFPVVEIPHRGELRLACVQPSVRPRTILRLCPTFATVRLWVGPVSYTRNCVSSAAAWYLVILVGPRKCPVAITGHLHLLIDLGTGQLGYFVRRLWTPAFAQEPFSDS